MSSPVQGSDQGAVQSSAQDPVHNDADTQQASLADLKHVSETHRLQHEVVEAAQRLESEAAENAFQLLPNNTVSFRIPVVRRAVERPSREEANERVWSALRSEFLAPPQRGWGVPGIAMVAGSIGAVILAAAVALLVVNLVQIPAPSVAASGEDEAARTESFSSAAVNLSKIATAQAKMQPADDEPQPAPPATTPPAPALATTPAPAPSTVVLAIAGPVSDIAPAKSPEPLPSPSPEIKPAAIETAPPSPPVPPSSSAAAPAPPAWRQWLWRRTSPSSARAGSRSRRPFIRELTGRSICGSPTGGGCLCRARSPRQARAMRLPTRASYSGTRARPPSSPKVRRIGRPTAIASFDDPASVSLSPAAYFGSSIVLTCAATTCQPSGNRTQVCIWRPTLPGWLAR